jgi:hypothetical protein
MPDDDPVNATRSDPEARSALARVSPPEDHEVPRDWSAASIAFTSAEATKGLVR